MKLCSAGDSTQKRGRPAAGRFAHSFSGRPPRAGAPDPMEFLLELLAPLAEVIAEFLLQIAFEWLAELGFRPIRAPFLPGTEARPAVGPGGYPVSRAPGRRLDP